MFFEPYKKTHYHFPSVNSITKYEVSYPFFFPESEKKDEFTDNISDTFLTVYEEKEHYL